MANSPLAIAPILFGFTPLDTSRLFYFSISSILCSIAVFISFARTDDIHNQVAHKIAGGIVAAQISAGRFPKATATEIAVNISLLAKEIKTAMEQRIEEIEK